MHVKHYARITKGAPEFSGHVGLIWKLVLAESNVPIHTHHRTLFLGIQGQALRLAAGNDSLHQRPHRLFYIFVIAALALAKPIPIVVELELAQEAQAVCGKAIEFRGHQDLGSLLVSQPPPTALINCTLASMRRRSRSASVRSFVKAIVCAVMTSKYVTSPPL